MVKHIILWTLKDGYEKSEKDAICRAAKEHLEGLFGVVPTLRAIKVCIEPLEGANCDMMLDAAFDNAAGLAEYAAHPAHVKVANEYVRPFVKQRVCMDYEEK